MSAEDKIADLILYYVPSELMADKNHTILVRPFLLGQYRIQVTDLRRVDPDAPPGHGEIVRELCSYIAMTCMEAIETLAAAPDVVAAVDAMGRPWNQEGPGGRIRLDNEPK